MTTTRWRLGLATLTGLLLAAPLLGLQPATADDESLGTVDGEPLTVAVRVGSYNIQASRSMEEFKAAITRFKPKVHVAGLQEIAGHVRNNWLADETDWGIYRAPNLGQIPIVWDTSVFRFLDGDEYLLALGRQVEGKDGGLVYKKDTYAPAARLHHLPTGRRFSIINVHLMNGAINVGEPDPEKPRTYALYVEQVASMMEAVEAERSAGYTPIVTGDFNISYAADAEKRIDGHPYAEFTAAGFRSIWKGRTLSPHGTHIDTECRPGVKVCGAYIDGVWAQDKAVRARVFRRIVHSDHYPLMGRFDVEVLPLP